MSLDTYTNLKAEIADYLNRTDLTSNIPTFITLAESKINRDLRLREQEQLSYTTLSSTATTPFIELPTGFIEFLFLKIKKDSEADSEYEELKYLPPSRIHEAYDCTDPAYYTIRDQIEINKIPSEDYTIRMHYIKKWDIATDGTNWLLTNHPDIYLYGALANAMPFIKNDKRVGLWTAAWQEALDSANEVSERSRDMTELDPSEYTDYRWNRSYNIRKRW